jgi:hypothetical protein
MCPAKAVVGVQGIANIIPLYMENFEMEATYMFLVYALLWAGFGLAWVFYRMTLEDIRITREYKMAKKRKENGLKIVQIDYK